MSKGLKYAFGAIALYLLVAYSGGVQLVSGAAKGGEGIIGAFQGGTGKPKAT
jgi:hypothetical protein